MIIKRSVKMLNENNTKIDVLVFDLSDYEHFVENNGCQYIGCNECEYLAECDRFAEY